MLDQRKISEVVRLLRLLSRDLHRDGYGLWHVPAQVADLLLQTDADEGGCAQCGAPVPVVRTGRPRKFCLRCSPRRHERKTTGKVDHVA